MSEYANGSGKSKLIIAITVIVVLAGGIWYFFMFKPTQEAKEKARLEQIAKEKAEQERIELEIQQKARYDKLIEDADVEFGQENWDSAKSLYLEAISIFPNQQYPQDQLVLVNIKLDEIAELEARKAAGTYETVSSSTGRFYVIVSSSLDDDLAMDFASQLAKEGNSVKIIEHDDGKHLYYRVSLGDYVTLEEATIASVSLSTVGKGVWVLKY